MLPRLQFRKQVADFISGKKDIVVQKGEVLKQENDLAENVEDFKKNIDFGFRCLHYSVSEGAGFIEVIVNNKSKTQCSIGVRTVDGEAKEGDDYGKVDEIINFEDGQETGSVSISIVDDEDWEPDEDFYVELYDPHSRISLEGIDTKTTITIIDDDKPGILSFETRSVKVIAKEGKAMIKVIRQHGSDGRIQCSY